MAMQNDELSKSLLHAQAHIWNHIFSFIKSMSLRCAVQLQIPDIIERHGSPMLLSELVEALGIKPEKTQFVYRLMRILVHCGFFVKPSVSIIAEEEEGGYILAPSSRLLLKEDPFSVRPYLLALLDPLLIHPFEDMNRWFQNDDVTPFHTTYGKSFYAMAGQEQGLNQLFNEAMASDARLVVNVILNRCRGVFEGLDSIVDVGSGTGTFGIAIAEAFPAISYINFDLPHVVNNLVGSKNLSYVGGDMFEAVPNANAVFLKWILHNWNDEECIKILKKCKEAIPNKEKGGKVMIIDMVMKADAGDNNFFETQLYFDMLMMVGLTGKQRSEKEWAKLFLDSGYNDYIITPVLGLRSLIEVYP